MQLLKRAELERRLLQWVKTVRRYPFFEGPISDSGVDVASSLSGSTGDDLRRWIVDIEHAAHDCKVPKEQYPDVAIYFLKGDLKEVMTKRREAYIAETDRGWWDWNDFQEDLKRIVEEATKIIASMPRVAVATVHPYLTSSIRMGLVIGGTAVLLPALTVALRRLNEAVSTPVSPSY